MNIPDNTNNDGISPGGAELLRELTERVCELHERHAGRLDQIGDEKRQLEQERDRLLAEVYGELDRARREIHDAQAREDADTLLRNKQAIADFETEVAGLRSLSAELQRQITEERAALHAGLDRQRKTEREALEAEREEAREQISRERKQARLDLEQEIETAWNEAREAIAAEKARARAEADALRGEHEALVQERRAGPVAAHQRPGCRSRGSPSEVARPQEGPQGDRRSAGRPPRRGREPPCRTRRL